MARCDESLSPPREAATWEAYHRPAETQVVRTLRDRCQHPGPLAGKGSCELQGLRKVKERPVGSNSRLELAGNEVPHGLARVGPSLDPDEVMLCAWYHSPVPISVPPEQGILQRFTSWVAMVQGSESLTY